LQLPRLDLAKGNTSGDFGGGDVAIALSFAKLWKSESDDIDYRDIDMESDEEVYPAWSGLSLGGSFKFIYETIDSYRSDGLAVDLGLLYALKDHRTRIGISASNLGAQLKGLSSGHKDPMPGILRFGVSHRLKSAPLTVTADGVQPFDHDIYAAAGVNFTHFNPVELRAGYSTLGDDYKTGADSDNWPGISFGFGLRLKQVVLDYAFLPYADLGESHRIALTTSW